MDLEFDARELQEEEHIYIKLPNNVEISIFKGDIGYSVDFINHDKDIIHEMGWVDNDEDLELYDEDEED